MYTAGVPFNERGGKLRGCLDLVSGRFPRFVFGGDVRDVLPAFHFHDVTADELEPKLQYLAENGYRTVNADDIAAFVEGAPAPGDRRVALCFDDAWASLWTVAAPLLKRYGLTAITYAIPARMEDAAACRPTIADGKTTAGEGPLFVTWPELRALHASGTVDVQSHTESHSMIFCGDEVIGFVTPEYAATPLLNRPLLATTPARRYVRADELGAPLYCARSRMSDGRRVAVSLDAHRRCTTVVAREGGAAFFTRPDWRTRLAAAARERSGSAAETESDQIRAIEDELVRGRAILNERLGTTSVTHICLPWGVSGRHARAALERLGYRTAIANRLRGLNAIRRGDDRYWLKRLPNRYIFRLPGRGRRLWP